MCHFLGSSELTRRQFIHGGLTMSAAVMGALPDGLEGRTKTSAVNQSMSNIDVARATSRWIEAAKATTEDGIFWLADPMDPDSAGMSLYHGSSGVVLFLLDLYRATDEKAYLDTACQGADAIMAVLRAETELQPGLYTGLAGMVFCLAEVYAVSDDPKYFSGAVAGLDMLLGAARTVGAGMEWNAVTDIVGGSSGIGLTLLNLADTVGGSDLLAVATAAGHRLVELGLQTPSGLKWPMSPDYRRLMPNFSHGTAGVAYYLATLYQKTGEERFLEAAVAGARYLQSIASTGDGDVCLVFHNEPDGEDLFYLSWCHGPVGTARLFYRLADITQEDEWLVWANMCARGIMQSGIPEIRTAGFWNNVSQCCGDAGVGEFFKSMYHVTGDQSYREFLQRVRYSLLSRAVEDASGMRWPQAEHRTRPGLIAAQTGYMQGAAGVGAFFLHLDAMETGRKPIVALPDSPFAV
ncbi:MAG: hypothetical protein JSW51_00035 [Gemmatimonadota bacterium]|nr:MAG: hypothetical protein JSW51_00035 [Gemmatimonadota bacterium]